MSFLTFDPSRRETVSLPSDGLRLAAHLYRPPRAAVGDVTPGIVMCGPVSSVKEQTLPYYAERFADAGFTVLTFDPRGFGESEGEPRFHYDPWIVIADYVNAAAHLIGRDDVDPARVAAVGVCMGGGYALAVAARERRLAACASVAGGYDIGGTLRELIGRGLLRVPAHGQRAARPRAHRRSGRLHPDDRARADAGGAARNHARRRGLRLLRAHVAGAGATWSWRSTAASLEPYLTFNALGQAPLVSPTPLLIVHGTTTARCCPKYAQAAFDVAAEPKQLV